MKLGNRNQIDTLIHRGKEPCIYWEERGFGCRVYKSGRKTWVLGYRAEGKKRLVTIGEYPAITYFKARDLAAAYRLQVEEGNDPLAGKQRQLSENPSIASVTSNKTSISALCNAY